MRREPGFGIEVAVLAILGFGVLAYGSTSYWASALLQAAIAVLFVAWWFAAARSRLPAEFEPRPEQCGQVWAANLGQKTKRTSFRLNKPLPPYISLRREQFFVPHAAE